MQHHYEGHWTLLDIGHRLFWAQMALASLVPFQGPKKSRCSGPTPSNAPRNDVARLKTITYRAIKTTATLVVLCTRVLLCSVVGVCSCVLLCEEVFRGGGGWQASPSHYSVGAVWLIRVQRSSGGCSADQEGAM